MNMFWGIRILQIFFYFLFFFFFFWGGGVIIKLDYTYGSFLCIYGIFVRSRYRMDDIFGSC